MAIKDIGISYEDGRWKHLAKKLVKEKFLEKSVEIDREGCFPEENVALLRENGFLSIGIEESKGGSGGNVFTSTLVAEELAQGCPSTAMAFLMHVSTLPLLSRLANEKQYEKFISKINTGKTLISYSQSEKGTGSRLWHMDSCAIELDGQYIINSFKSFATSSGYCDAYMLVVRGDEDAAPNELSIFFVDAKDPNIKIIGEWDGMGLRGNASTPVHFKDILVSKDRLFGQKNTAYNLIMAYTFPSYIIGLSSVYLGIAKKALACVTEYVHKRTFTNDNKSLGQVETVQRYLSEMKIEIDTLKAYQDYVAKLTVEVTKVFDQLYQADMLEQLLDNAQKDDFFLQLAQLKVRACETAISVTNKAMQVHGGTGYKRGSVVEQCYRDARAGSLMGPSDDILKTIIGKRMVDLPLPWNEVNEIIKEHEHTV